MKLRRTIVAVLSVSLILLIAAGVLAAPAVHWSGLPKLDRWAFKAYPGASPDVVVGEFLDCTTDWIEGPGRGDLYDAVIDAGHVVSPMNNMSEFTFAPINGRDYKLTSGLPNAPLNDSSFRLALSYIYGMDDKDADVFGYYGVPWFSALGNPVPPAQQPWYDEVTQMPNTDNVTAWNILVAGGYSIADYGGQQWLHRNGVPVRPPDGPNGGIIDFWYSTGAEVYPQGPGGGLVRNFNAFIQDYKGAEGPLMQISPTDFTTLVVDLLAVRDYDIIGIGLTNLGRYVDWIYDIFHSVNDVPWGWNFCGSHDAEYDYWADIILTDMDPLRVQAACENWTRKFVNVRMDWLPLITGQDFATAKNLGATELTNIISMENYGPRNDWSWMCAHWSGTPKPDDECSVGVWPGGVASSALGDEPDTLNPWTDDTLYGWNLMDRAIIGLTGLNPETLKVMPFVATKWTLTNWTSIPELGIANGSTAQFWLRQDVPWHDSTPAAPHYVDSYDCVANMLFMLANNPGRYSGTWAHLVYSEADGPYKFNTYFDQTSLYYADYVSGTSLLVPEHVIEVVEDYWQTWAPCDNVTRYAGLGLGPPPAQYPQLTQLVGCGPFVFEEYNRALAIGSVVKFGNTSTDCTHTEADSFFVTDPVIAGLWTPGGNNWLVLPGNDFDYEVVVQNVGAKGWTDMGHVNETTIDVEIYQDDVLTHTVSDLTLAAWEHQYLPGSSYKWAAPGCGYHTVKVIVRGNSFKHTYVHGFVVTIREDVTTYCGSYIDFKVDMRDVGRAARAFGSSPGHPRWDPCCDINDDFKVDMRDIGAVARRFGWTC